MFGRSGRPRKGLGEMSALFRLLGDVEVCVNERPIDIGPARVQCVLVGLLVDVNHCVSTDQLVERVWGSHRLPVRPRNALQTYVSLLRKALAAELTIECRPAGYRARVAPDAVDMHRFGQLVRQAADAADNDAASLLEQALGLWRGEAFGPLDSPWLATVRARLDKERRAARLDLADVQLRRGEHGRLLAMLCEWAEEYPLDERLAGQYMVALHRSGRTADALRVFRRVRERLVCELGTDPCPELQRLHQQILAFDPVLATPAERAGTGSVRCVPRQLPSPPWSFVGRAEHLAQLDSTCAARAAAGTMPIFALCGIGGIGKTWLGLRWAHHNLAQFPDGQLYVNLRGFEPSGLPTPPATVLYGFLTALGVQPGAIPPTLDARAALFRTMTADKRLLIMLDNARDTGQIGPLLPGSPTCVVLITSRNPCTDLVSTHGAVQVCLTELSDPDARAVLIHRIGADRIRAEDRAAEEILSYCAGMPLALGIAAATATAHARLPLATVAGQLREAMPELDMTNG